ncbi:MAG: sigma-70 family RNA polymerase sigma factor [Bacillota bacterium]
MNDPTQRARFERLAMPHMNAAHNLARWLAGNDDDAADITQEAFVRAFRFFDGFRGDDVRPWLLAIVRNTYYTQWRQARSSSETAAFDEELHSFNDDASLPEFGRAGDGDPVAILSARDDVRLLDRALERLPVEYREALVLHELEDLSYRQIASTLDVPIGTVMSRIARARRLLLESFKRLNGEIDEHDRSPRGASRVDVLRSPARTA